MKRAVGLLLLLFPLIGMELTAQSLSNLSITGTPNISSSITGVFTGVMGPTGDHYHYKWFYSSGTVLSSTTTSYSIQTADNGKEIFFKVSILNDKDSVLVCDSTSVTVNSVPVGSSPAVVGEPKPGLTVFGYFVFNDVDGDSEGGSLYQWHTASDINGTGSADISGATSYSYKIKDDDSTKFLGFSVTPRASSGSNSGALITTTKYVDVQSNKPPKATVQNITGSRNVNGVLTGHYSYSDYEGDLESGTSYEWTRSLTSGGTFVSFGETSISHQITMDEQGMYFKFTVTPHAATGSNSTVKYTSSEYGKVNSKPYATSVSISGTPSVGQELTGVYTYHDDDLGETQGTSLFQWFRDGNPITGATANKYTLVLSDFGKLITFKVTPVTSGTSYPNTGDTFASSAVGPVDDPGGVLPSATDICIAGTRQSGQELSGYYTYLTNGINESGSRFIWLRGKVVLKEGKLSSNKKYTLVADDIGSEIRYAVVPKNENDQIGDTVFSDPLAIFDLSRDVFSETDSAQLLKAKPMGGIFSGSGVTNGYFYPKNVGSTNSPYILSYVLTITNNSRTCAQTATKSVEVRPIVVEFSGIDPVYCDNHGPDTIYVLNVPPLASLRRFTITDPGSNLTMITDTSAVFYPDRMNSGDLKDIIFYSYQDVKSFVEIRQGLVIDHFGEVSIRNLESGTSICNNAEPFELFTSHAGGIFSGPVTAERKLDPSLVSGGYGPATVTYAYTSPSGCSQTVIVPIVINPVPDISFTPADFCILNSSDTTRLINTTNSVDSVSIWFWEFSEAGITSSSNKKEPSFLYKTGGDHKITLTATTLNGCTSKKDETFDIGVKPTAGFSWKNECFHTDDSLLFKDETVSSSLIQSRRWIFYGIDTIDNVTNPKYPQKSTGYMSVRFVVTTGYEGCNDSITRNIYIRPTITIPKAGYDQKFETGNGDWVPDYAEVNSWTFGTPDRKIINTAASGVNAWFTKFDTARTESSSVVSPCFNFDSIQRPMIRLMLYKRFDWNRDGAVLQYRVGDSGSWELVGTLEDGILWYNSPLIKGRPGGDQMVGWTSRTSDTIKWAESSHKIDELQGKKDVKFRIAYGSDGTSQDNDGIAFDDIWIGGRTRSVLLEHFANTTLLKSSTATAMVNTIVGNSAKDVINIQYHTNFPGTDPYNTDNPADNSARILYYGLIKAPYSFVDGGNGIDYAKIYDYNLATLDSNDLTRRSLINPFFKIEITPEIYGGVLTVSGKLTAISNKSSENMTLYIAVTEKENNEHSGANGETIFYNVFRKFIPDAGGINLKETWGVGDSFEIPEQSWLIRKIKSNSDIEVIAFIQNNITKEIYQASSVIKPDVVTGIDNLIQGSGNDFAVYPNPAVNTLTLSFKEPLLKDALVKIYDMRGIVISTLKVGSGISEFHIDNLNLKSGIYLVRISSGGFDLGFRKLVISGN